MVIKDICNIMGEIKGKFIRLECDNGTKYHNNESTGDYAGHTYKEAFRNAENDGWKKIKENWYCPYCVSRNKYNL